MTEINNEKISQNDIDVKKIINLDTNYDIKYVNCEEAPTAVKNINHNIPWCVNTKTYELYQKKQVIKNDTPLVKIAATVGPKVESVESLIKLFESGVKILRIILLYNSPANNKKLLHQIKLTTEQYRVCFDNNFQPTIVHEIASRYTKVGRLKNNKPIRLYAGDTITLTTERRYAYYGCKEILYVNCTDSIMQAEVGEEIILDVGIFLEIVAITATDIECIINQGGYLNSYAWCTMPRNTNDELSTEEQTDLNFAVENEADFIIVPMFHLSSHYELISAYVINQCGFRIPLLCGVIFENPFPKSIYNPLIKIYAGFWIATRKCFESNDVEMHVIEMCIKHNKMLIMHVPIDAISPCELEINKPTCDTFKNSFCCCDCVMIARSPPNINFPKNAKKLINNCKYIKSANTYEETNKAIRILIDSKRDDLSHANVIAANVAIISFVFDAGAIVVYTRSGLTAVEIAKRRPQCYIIAIITSRYTFRRLQLRRGIFPLLYTKPIRANNLLWNEEIEIRLNFGIEYAKKNNFMEFKSKIVCCYNSEKDSGHNNTIRLIDINENIN